MTELSPATYKVLSAVTQHEYSLDPEDIPQLAARIGSGVAAALRAVADQLTFKDSLAGDVINPRELLALANEMTQQHPPADEEITNFAQSEYGCLESDPLTVTRTERGWPGHYICADRCRFRRNTLLQCGSIKIVVSTVGLQENISRDGFETIGPGRYFETMAFHSDYTDLRYFDADVCRGVRFESPWQISEIDADDVANNQHEAVVNEITQNLAAGKTYTE